MDHALAHKIYAGCDLFLMPSMFEPCGLSQLISLRYGTLPITRETGGLRDTVLAYNKFTGDGNGFTFLNYNAHDMLHVIEQAVHMYHTDRELFNKIAQRAMRGLYGWDQSAQKYVALYRQLTGEKAEPVVEVEVKAEEQPVAQSEEKPKKTTRRKTAKVDGEAAPKKTTRKKAEPAAEDGEAPKKATRKRSVKAESTDAAATEKKPRTRKKAEPKPEENPAE